MRVEPRIADRQCQRARRQACLAKTFARFLREVAEQGVQCVRVVRVFAKRVIVRNGFWFGVDDEFVGIAATRLAI